MLLLLLLLFCAVHLVVRVAWIDGDRIQSLVQFKSSSGIRVEPVFARPTTSTTACASPSPLLPSVPSTRGSGLTVFSGLNDDSAR